MSILEGVVGRAEVGVKSGWRCVKREICSSDVPEYQYIHENHGSRTDLEGYL